MGSDIMRPMYSINCCCRQLHNINDNIAGQFTAYDTILNTTLNTTFNTVHDTQHSTIYRMP